MSASSSTAQISSELDAPMKAPWPGHGRMHFGFVLLISLGSFCLMHVVTQALQWSDLMEGLLSGVAQTMFFGWMMWAVLLLPWSLAVYGLYRWRGWGRFRTMWVMAPLVVMGTGILIDGVMNPLTPAGRLKRISGAELPREVRNLKFYFSSGGLADYRDVYYFEASPQDVARLIAEMRLNEDLHVGCEGLKAMQLKGLPGCPNPSTWQGGRRYHRDDRSWFYDLVTDAGGTKVYVLIRCI